MYGEGTFYVIPSFFKLMMYLKKVGRDFAICFRTMGQDMTELIEEFNAFCEGRHPYFDGRHGLPAMRFDGTQGSKDYRISHDN